MTTHRMISGWVSKAQINNTASSIVEDFPRQSDQPSSLDWMVLGDYDDFEDVEEIVGAFDYSEGGFGGYSFTWEMMLTPGMLRYLEQQFCAGVFHAPVTVVTEDTTSGRVDVADQWRAVQARIHFPRKGRRRRPEAGNPYWTYQFLFDDGRDATAGSDLSVTVSHTGTLIVGTAKAYTVTVANEGDDTTFADIVVTVTLDANSDYASHSASGWTVTYSTDGTSYSGTAPGDLTTVTHLRFTRATALAADANASFTVSITPTDNVTITQAAAVTTTGDGAVGAKSDTDAALAIDVPVANFTADVTSGAAPLLVTFTDTSTNIPTSWAWDFTNDASTDATTQNASFTYNSPGTYTCKLTATNAAGSDEHTVEITVS